MTQLVALIASVLCGVLGRMGGSGKFNTKFRDLGIPTVFVISALITGIHSWWLFLTFLLMFGALTTYWDFLFGYDNYWFHGFMIGISLVPLAFPNHWAWFGISVALYTLWMGFWSKIIKWDVLEELGRYFIIPIALLFV